ncbi:MAG: DUF6174 domain-containing protein [Candidatus Zixiibacteriota bacterium]
MFSKLYVVQKQGGLLLVLGLILVIVVQIGCSDDNGNPISDQDTTTLQNTTDTSDTTIQDTTVSDTTIQDTTVSDTTDRSPGWERRLWDSLGSNSYEIDQSLLCFCPFWAWDLVRLTVVDDSIVSGIVLSDSTALPSERLNLYLTIPQLFDFIESARARDAFEIRTSYDSTLGYPIYVWVDYIQEIADEEMGYTSRNYRPLAK